MIFMALRDATNLRKWQVWHEALQVKKANLLATGPDISSAVEERGLFLATRDLRRATEARRP